MSNEITSIVWQRERRQELNLGLGAGWEETIIRRVCAEGKLNVLRLYTV